jgi:putative ATP-dependent endonuclease of the OLD family
MRLDYLKITNLRGIRSTEIHVHNYTTLIGPNNCCKSTVARAIQILLEQQTPEVDEWHRGKETEPLIIEGRFVDVTDDERKISGISALVRDGEIRLRAYAESSAKADEMIWQVEVQQETFSGFADSLKECLPIVQKIAADLGLNGTTWKTGANKEKVREIIRKAHPEMVTAGEMEWTDEGMSIKPALKQGMPRVLIVPAVRDAKDESKITQRKNCFAEIFQNEVLPELKETTEFKAMEASAVQLRNRFSGATAPLEKTSKVTDGISTDASDILEFSLSISVEPDLEGVFGSSAKFLVGTGGAHTPVHLQGHGAQRTLIFALIQYIAKRGDLKRSEPDKRSIILLFEEPELYIHPHLLRSLKVALKKIAARTGWQVVVTTHSPVMVDVADVPQSLVIFRRGPAGELIKHQLKEDPFAADGKKQDRQVLRATLDFHPTVCEAFFANSTVLVEGDSELAVLSLAPEVFKALELERDLSTTTVVSCDGKWTIVPFCRLLKAFGIPFKVVHDTDISTELVPGENANNSEGVLKANAAILEVAGAGNIHTINSTLEDILYETPGNRYKSDKPIRAWRRVKELAESPGNLKAHARLLALYDFVYPNEKPATVGKRKTTKVDIPKPVLD